MNRYVLGVDIGSSTLKITFLDSDGNTIGPFRREIKSYMPKLGWVEQNPQDWLALFADTLREAKETANIDAGQILAVAPDSTTHTTVLLDKNFRPVRPVILWNDQRSHEIAGEMGPERAKEIFGLSYHPPGAMWSLFHNLWVKRHEPEVWDKVVYMMFAKDYFRFCLTGEYMTDFIDAQGSQFLDVRKNEWSDTLCDIMEFPARQLPLLKKPTDCAGFVTEQAASATGLAKGTKVFVGTTDTVMEMLASGAILEGQSTIKLATAGRVCVISKKAYPDRLLVNYSHVVGGMWYPGTGTRSCASSLRWYKDNFAQLQEHQAKQQNKSVYTLLDEMAREAEVGSGKLFYHPYLLGEFTPYADADLRASFVGAAYHHTNANFARAVMEGCAYSMRDCLDVIYKLQIPTSGDIRLIGGGAMSDLWSQIVSDVIGRNVVRPIVSDSSFGSAMLAGVALEMFADYYDAVKKCVKYDDPIVYNERNAEKYNVLFGYYKKIQSLLQGLYGDLAAETL